MPLSTAVGQRQGSPRKCPRTAAACRSKNGRLPQLPWQLFLGLPVFLKIPSLPPGTTWRCRWGASAVTGRWVPEESPTRAAFPEPCRAGTGERSAVRQKTREGSSDFSAKAGTSNAFRFRGYRDRFCGCRRMVTHSTRPRARCLPATWGGSMPTLRPTSMTRTAHELSWRQ
jgi:hypothetical protein